MHRDDDTPEAIEHRLDLYEQQTSPLIEFYNEQGRHGRGRRCRLARRGVPPSHVGRRVDASTGLMASADGRRLMRRHPPAHGRRAAPHARGRARWWPRCTRRCAPRPGPVSPRASLDRVARDVLERRHATSNFLGYHGFPAVICASVNDEVVHGIPGEPRAGGGRPAVDRLWCHRQRLARRRRVHAWASAPSRPTRSG